MLVPWRVTITPRLVNCKRGDVEGMSWNVTISGWWMINFTQVCHEICHDLQIFFNTSLSKHPQIQGCFSNQNEGFPSTIGILPTFLNVLPYFLGFKPYFFWNAGLVVSIDLAMCPIFFPLCWLDPSCSRAGAKSGDDGTSSPSKDGSDDTRTCCLPTGANFGLNFGRENRQYIYIYL